MFVQKRVGRIAVFLWSAVCFVQGVNSVSGAVTFTGNASAEDPNKPVRMTWETIPGLRYDLMRSTDLSTWTRVSGYPKTIFGVATFQSLDSANNQFFEIIPLDEQAPEIVEQYPEDEVLGIGRFAEIFVELTDMTGVDASSISLMVGALGPFTSASSELTIEGNTLVLDTGAMPLGDWGETLTAALTVADTLGNSDTYSWVFTLQPEPMVEANIFVFGSADAVQSGQQLSGPAAAVAAASPGSTASSIAPAGSVTSWRIDSVTETEIVISYDAAPAPTFAANALLCNDAPGNESEFFYRRLLSVSDDTDAMILTLTTEDATLEDFIIQGGASIDGDAVIIDFDAAGAMVGVAGATAARAWQIDLPSLGPNASNVQVASSGGATLTMKQLRWTLDPSLTAAVEFQGKKLTYFGALLRGQVRSAVEAEMEYTSNKSLGGSIDVLDELGLPSVRKRLLKLLINGVPVILDLTFNLSLNYDMGASAEARMGGGFEHNYRLGFSVEWEKGDDQPTWRQRNQFNNPQAIPFHFEINGNANASFSLVPEIGLELNRLANVHVNVDPTYEFIGTAVGSSEEATSAEWTIRRYGNLNVGVGITSITSRDFPLLQLFNTERVIRIPETMLQIEKHPPDFFDHLGGNVATDGTLDFNLMVVATGPEGENDPPITYQWYHRGVAIPGKTRSSLFARNAGGFYYVDVIQGTNRIRSELINFFFLGTPGG